MFTKKMFAFMTQIEHILCGSKEIGDLKELRQGTTYKGNYTDTSPVVQWFWVSKFCCSARFTFTSSLLSFYLAHTSFLSGFNSQDYLSSLSLSDKRKFLHFVTGSERAPLGGLSNLK